MKSQEVFIRFMAAKSTNRRNSNLIAIDYSNIAIWTQNDLLPSFRAAANTSYEPLPD